MRVGIPKEIKPQEYRVGLTPAGVRELVSAEHDVYVQAGAGLGIGIPDEQYQRSGAVVLSSAEEVFEEAELIVKVKEPLPEESGLLQKKHLLFTFLHLAANRELTEQLLASEATCIAYETVTDPTGALPLLSPMSEVAGRLSIQASATCLEKNQGGKGVLMAGIPGVAPANVLILGGGVVGLNAARVAIGMGARVTLMDKSLPRLRGIDELYGPSITCLYSTQETIERLLPSMDVVIGAVLVPGASAPKLITEDDLRLLEEGSVMVDVAIDQGGCFASSRPTTHDMPTYIHKGVVHYCVANMPGIVAKTSSFALTDATLPYIQALAGRGKRALLEDAYFLSGVNLSEGEVTHRAVADSLGMKYSHPGQVLRPAPSR